MVAQHHIGLRNSALHAWKAGDKRWMPSRLSPLVVAAVSAAAAAAAAAADDDDHGGGGDDDDDDDNDNGDYYDDDFTCSTKSHVNGKTIHVGDKPCLPRYPLRKH